MTFYFLKVEFNKLHKAFCCHEQENNKWLGTLERFKVEWKVHSTYNASILYINVKINPDFRLCKFSCKTERFDHSYTPNPALNAKNFKPKMETHRKIILESI